MFEGLLVPEFLGDLPDDRGLPDARSTDEQDGKGLGSSLSLGAHQEPP
jgi:hypothetical protein